MPLRILPLSSALWFDPLRVLKKLIIRSILFTFPLAVIMAVLGFTAGYMKFGSTYSSSSVLAMVMNQAPPNASAEQESYAIPYFTPDEMMSWFFRMEPLKSCIRRATAVMELKRLNHFFRLHMTKNPREFIYLTTAPSRHRVRS